MTNIKLIIKLYLELLILSNDWKSFIDLNLWYWGLPCSRSDIKESLANAYSNYYSEISKQQNCLELYNVLKVRFKKFVDGIKNGGIS